MFKLSLIRNELCWFMVFGNGTIEYMIFLYIFNLYDKYCSLFVLDVIIVLLVVDWFILLFSLVILIT